MGHPKDGYPRKDTGFKAIRTEGGMDKFIDISLMWVQDLLDIFIHIGPINISLPHPQQHRGKEEGVGELILVSLTSQGAISS